VFVRVKLQPGAGGKWWHGARGAGTTKPVVYNTVEEIRRFGEVLGKIAGSMS
jgi:hypothetical protein